MVNCYIDGAGVLFVRVEFDYICFSMFVFLSDCMAGVFEFN